MSTILTIKIITDHARAAAAKVAAGELLTGEDKTFVTNVLVDYARRLDTRSDSIANRKKQKGKQQGDEQLASVAQYVLSRRIERDYKTLLGQPVDRKKKPGRKKKKPAGTLEPQQPEFWTA